VSPFSILLPTLYTPDEHSIKFTPFTTRRLRFPPTAATNKLMEFPSVTAIAEVHCHVTGLLQKGLPYRIRVS
jgi:hypothetical protein